VTQSASILYLHDGHGVEESLFFNGIIRTGLNKVDSTTLGHLWQFRVLSGPPQLGRCY